MKKRWKEAGLIFVTTLAVWFTDLLFYPYFLKITHIPQGSFLSYVVFLILPIGVYLASVKWIERRNPNEFSPPATPLLTGAIAGFALISLSLGLFWILGGYQFQSFHRLTPAEFGFFILSWLAVAFSEELLFRATIYRLFINIFGTWTAILLSSIFFAIAHFSPTAGVTITGFSLFIYTFLAGVMLSAAYTATGKLWLPIGLHFGWDFATGAIFEFMVKGKETNDGLAEGLVALIGSAFFLWIVLKKQSKKTLK
jgi:membrane protease YdiL (CAAX protease family)